MEVIFAGRHLLHLLGLTASLVMTRLLQRQKIFSVEKKLTWQAFPECLVMGCCIGMEYSELSLPTHTTSASSDVTKANSWLMKSSTMNPCSWSKWFPRGNYQIWTTNLSLRYEFQYRCTVDFANPSFSTTSAWLNPAALSSLTASSFLVFLGLPRGR